MNRETKKRKRSFWAFCMVLMLALVNIMPTTVFAANHAVDDLQVGDYLMPGDVIDSFADGLFAELKYYDGAGDYERGWPDGDVYNIESYSEVFGGTDDGMCWKVTTASFSSDCGRYDIILEACAIPEFDISYVLDGGTNDDSNPETYAYGTGVSSFADASKDKYDFEGWYSDADYEEKITSISATQMGEITLYAKFTPKKYDISYVLDGGTNNDGNPDTYTYGTGVGEFLDADKEGYSFEGWYSDPEYTEPVTDITDIQTGEVTLYAKFTPKKYDISYVLDGGTNDSNNPDTYTYGVGVSSLAKAVKTGYTFEGWYSDSECTVSVTSISATQTGDVTLYAKYKAVTPDVDAGDVMPVALMAVLVLLSGAGIILMRKKRHLINR